MDSECCMNVSLHLGDCLKILPTLTGIDVVITDPPYGISGIAQARIAARHFAIRRLSGQWWYMATAII